MPWSFTGLPLVRLLSSALPGRALAARGSARTRDGPTREWAFLSEAQSFRLYAAPAARAKRAALALLFFFFLLPPGR